MIWALLKQDQVTTHRRIRCGLRRSSFLLPCSRSQFTESFLNRSGSGSSSDMLISSSGRIWEAWSKWKSFEGDLPTLLFLPCQSAEDPSFSNHRSFLLPFQNPQQNKAGLFAGERSDSCLTAGRIAIDYWDGAVGIGRGRKGGRVLGRHRNLNQNTSRDQTCLILDNQASDLEIKDRAWRCEREDTTAKRKWRCPSSLEETERREEGRKSKT